jgi:hypothetical protein
VCRLAALAGFGCALVGSPAGGGEEREGRGCCRGEDFEKEKEKGGGGLEEERSCPGDVAMFKPCPALGPPCRCGLYLAETARPWCSKSRL